MKISKDDSQTSVEIDMTPMIDVVFQLIIFFMLITDMTQKDLEELYLPKAKVAVADKPNPNENRPIINILSDGSVWVKRENMFDPLKDDKFRKLKEYLARMAKAMPKKPINPADPGSRKVPDTPLLVRADQATPAKYIQKVMEVCGTMGIEIWKVELAAATVMPDEVKP